MIKMKYISSLKNCILIIFLIVTVYCILLNKCSPGEHKIPFNDLKFLNGSVVSLVNNQEYSNKQS